MFSGLYFNTCVYFFCLSCLIANIWMKIMIIKINDPRKAFRTTDNRADEFNILNDLFKEQCVIWKQPFIFSSALMFVSSYN